MIPNHPAVVEAASWRIVTELCRRTPALSIYQYHPGGGQNDCLALMHPTLGMVANLNRNGTFHAQRRLDTGEPAHDECWLVWEEVIHSPMRDLVNRASVQIGQAVPARLPASVPRVVVYRSVAAILALHAFAPRDVVLPERVHRLIRLRGLRQPSVPGFFPRRQGRSAGRKPVRPRTPRGRDVARPAWGEAAALFA